MDIRETRGGLRISQHGVLISELRNLPGPTHSLFDVLAALMVILFRSGRVGLLGFAGGSVMAPLRKLGFGGPVDAVDLNQDLYRIFRDRCGGWAGDVFWHHGDAVEWLRSQDGGFGLIVEDLSVPEGGDVIKPGVSWDELPRLVRSRLAKGGTAIFNLLPGGDGQWPNGLREFKLLELETVQVELDEYCNRILVVGVVPSARVIARRLAVELRRLRSRQVGKVRVRAGLGR